MAQHDEPVGAAYDRLASTYDQAYADHRALAENYVLRRELTPLVSARQDVLDLGCGTGFLLDLIPTLDPGRYTGADVSEAMLCQARVKHPQGMFIVGDQSNLTLTQKFDVVTSLWSLNHATLDHVTDTIQGAWRTLRPGGTFFAVMGGPRRLTRAGYAENTPCQRAWPAKTIRKALDWWPGIKVRGLAMSVDRMPAWVPQAAQNLMTAAESATLGRVLPDACYFFIVRGVKP